MKRALIILGLVVILTACGTASTSADREERFTVYDRYLTITTDKETGCKYIVLDIRDGYAGAGGVTPLMLPNGTQDCK